MIQPLFDFIQKLPKWVSVIILILYCLTASEVNDMLLVNSNLKILVPQYYTYVRTFCYGFNFITSMAIWFVTSVIFHLAGLFVGGEAKFRDFLFNSSILLIFGITLYLVDFFLICNSYIEFRGSLDETIESTALLETIRLINYIIYFVLSFSYVLVIKYLMSTKWLEAVLAVCVPIIVIVWTYELVGLL